MEKLIRETINHILMNLRLEELKIKKAMNDSRNGLEMPITSNHPLEKIIEAVCESQSFAIKDLVNNTGSDSKRGWIRAVICHIANKNAVKPLLICDALNITIPLFNQCVRNSTLKANSDENYKTSIYRIECSIDHGSYVSKMRSTPINHNPVKLSYLDLFWKQPRKMTMEYLIIHPEMIEGNFTVGDVKTKYNSK